MNIAFVSNVVYPFVSGGAQKRIHEIGTRLAARGHDVTIYSRHSWDGPPEITHQGMTLQAVAPDTDLYLDEGRRSIVEAVDFAFRLTPTLWSRVGTHDVIVASVFPYFPVISSKICSMNGGAPLVTTWHEVWTDYWREYLGRLSAGGKLVEHLVARIPQHPIAVSELTADRLSGLGVPREDIRVIPNGIDMDEIRSAPLPASNGETTSAGFDVLFAGRLIKEKRVDVLLNAFDRVAETHDATLGIIGDGPEADRLERLAGSLECAENVTFLGFIEDHDDVLGHMRAARVFASPSVREGFGITYVEAMAAGCTVIGADHPNSAAGEVIGEAGYLPKPTVPGVASALASALSNEELNEDPIARAQRYNWDTIASRAEEAYREIVSSYDT